MYTYIFSSISLFFLYNYIEFNYFLKKKETQIVSSKYIIVNKTKSAVLLFLTPLSIYYSFIFIHNIEVTNKLILDFIGGLYASTDMSAMFFNRKTHLSTWVHHILVQFLYYYCFFNNFEMNYSLCRPICTYCCFSSMAYLVNYRLAIRYKNDRFEQVTNDLSFFIYFSTCTINWIIQSYFLLGGVQLGILEKIGYLSVLIMIIYDDVFLMKFLSKTFKLKNYEHIEKKLSIDNIKK